MDYKERYEMALEGIQEILGSGEDSIKMSRLQLRLQGIFPELKEFKECDDEKIRKSIIEFVKQNKSFHYLLGVSKEDAVAWLEKQGEQNLVNTDLDELVIQLEETIGTSPHSRETIKDFFQMAIQKYMNCLRIANGEIGRLIEENYWLKEKQCEQKPAWSEEDIAIISRVISIVKWAAYSDHSHPILNDEGATELIDWLKSLRPQSTWKPSDEQIGVIEAVINNRSFQRRHLDSLYTDLKKLKKE